MFTYNPVVWRKFHILGKVQVFIVASVCAAVLSLPFALSVVSHNEAALLHDLLWPDRFDPMIVFGAVFLSILPFLLAYYHLGRLGAMLGLAVSITMWYVTMIGAVLAFMGNSAWLGLVEYIGFVLLMYLLVFVAHRKATRSHTIQDAQHKLRLV